MSQTTRGESVQHLIKSKWSLHVVFMNVEWIGLISFERTLAFGSHDTHVRLSGTCWMGTKLIDDFKIDKVFFVGLRPKCTYIIYLLLESTLSDHYKRSTAKKIDFCLFLSFCFWSDFKNINFVDLLLLSFIFRKFLHRLTCNMILKIISKNNNNQFFKKSQHFFFSFFPLKKLNKPILMQNSHLW